MVEKDLISQLRAETGAGVGDCHQALVKANGNIVSAKKFLRMQGHEILAHKVTRETPQGFISSYIHHNRKVGVMVEIRCETDFAIASLRDFAKDICMQIAATNPEFVCQAEIPEARLATEKEFFLAQIAAEGKPAHIVEKILTGRMKKFCIDTCLLEQKSVKDGTITIGDLLAQKVEALHENIVIKRFCRFQLE